MCDICVYVLQYLYYYIFQKEHFEHKFTISNFALQAMILLSVLATAVAASDPCQMRWCS